MTNEQIYKIYKHGGGFENRNLSLKKIYSALKSYGLQVVKVQDRFNKLYIYDEDKRKFYQLFAE